MSIVFQALCLSLPHLFLSIVNTTMKANDGENERNSNVEREGMIIEIQICL